MWTDDEYSSVRTPSAVKAFQIEKLVDAEEFDLGIVDIADLEIELADLGPHLTPPRIAGLAIQLATRRKP